MEELPHCGVTVTDAMLSEENEKMQNKLIMNKEGGEKWVLHAKMYVSNLLTTRHSIWYFKSLSISHFGLCNVSLFNNS